MPVVLDTPLGAGQALRDLRIGRLALPTIEGDLAELIGEPLAAQSDTAAYGNARAFQFTVPVYGSRGDANPPEVGDRMRRQSRSLFENEEARQEGYYLAFSPDPEQNCWLLVGQGELAYADGGPTLGQYQLRVTEARILGRQRTDRPGRRLELYDRRLSTVARDTLAKLRSTDFAGMALLALHPLPSGVSDLEGSFAVVPVPITRPAAEGPVPLLVGRPHADAVSFEQAEADLHKNDVVVYDKRGLPDQTAANPGLIDLQQLGYEEVYGHDYPFTAHDVPIVQNGLCRVRYDPSNTPGFRVDAWTGAAWAEQGKVYLRRSSAVGYNALALRSASVYSWAPDAAVIEVVMAAPTDPTSRERVFITLKRGWSGPRFEVYAAPNADGSDVVPEFNYSPAVADPNDTLVKLDSVGGSGQVASTLGGVVLAGNVGAGSFPGENWLAMLRQGAALGAHFSVLQAAAIARAWSNDASAYGAARTSAQVSGLGGYLGVRIGYHAQASDQTLEAEAIRFAGAGSTATQVADAGASGGQAVQDTQASQAHKTLNKAATNMVLGARYRHFARVKIPAGATGSFVSYVGSNYAGAGTFGVAGTGAFVWIDLGEAQVATDTHIDFYAWRASGAGNVLVDAVRYVKLEDRASAAPSYDGARDLGQESLATADAIGVVVPR